MCAAPTAQQNNDKRLMLTLPASGSCVPDSRCAEMCTVELDWTAQGRKQGRQQPFCPDAGPRQPTPGHDTADYLTWDRHRRRQLHVWRLMGLWVLPRLLRPRLLVLLVSGHQGPDLVAGEEHAQQLGRPEGPPARLPGVHILQEVVAVPCTAQQL